MACTREINSQAWQELGLQLKSSEGVPVSDKTYNFRTYKSVFVGSEAVDWMINNEFANTREEAIHLGQEMLQNDVFHHVTYDHTFKDAYLFYRFPEDDPLEQKLSKQGPSVASLLADCGVTKAGFVHRKGTVFWNKRYLLVKQDEGKLYYFMNDLEPSPKYAIDLSDGVSVREEPGVKKGAYCFTIFSAAKEWTFACESSADQREWIKSLVEAGMDMVETQSVADFSQKSIHDFTCKDIDGNSVSLEKYRGTVCLIVNVASK